MPSNEPTVLVTRPAHQSENLCVLLAENGFKPIRFPTIEIQPINSLNIAAESLQKLDLYDYLIFVSSNAVINADALIKNQWRREHVEIIAIGPSTANTLNKIGLIPNIIAHKPFSSEQLLKQFPGDLQQKRGLIIKGEGGRNLLAQQLIKRGMAVDYIDVYKRTLPSRTCKLNITPPEYITVTSQLALTNLFTLQKRQASDLKKFSTFIVFSQRIADYAKTMGCQHIMTGQEASDAGLITSIVQSKNSNTF